MPQRLSNAACKVAAVIHGQDGATVWGTVTYLANDRCEIECDQVFRCNERVDIHMRGMGQIRASVTSVEGAVITARFIEGCLV